MNEMHELTYMGAQKKIHKGKINTKMHHIIYQKNYYFFFALFSLQIWVTTHAEYIIWIISCILYTAYCVYMQCIVIFIHGEVRPIRLIETEPLVCSSALWYRNHALR